MRSQNSIANQIISLLERLELVAGISMEEPGYEFLENAMLQGKMALQIGKKKKPDCNFFIFQEVYTDYVMMALAENQDIQSFCHPVIQKILRDPDPWSLELLQTLSVYLQNGRRVSATAEKLFIHRNTLVNRLQQIEKTFGIDFDKMTDNDLDLLLISCFIAKSMMPFHFKEGSDFKN
jgi:sugar diacid utilization regulator